MPWHALYFQSVQVSISDVSIRLGPRTRSKIYPDIAHQPQKVEVRFFFFSFHSSFIPFIFKLDYCCCCHIFSLQINMIAYNFLLEMQNQKTIEQSHSKHFILFISFISYINSFIQSFFFFFKSNKIVISLLYIFSDFQQNVSRQCSSIIC